MTGAPLPKADLDAAREFLTRWAPAGPWVLTAIDVDRKSIETRTFHPGAEVYLTSWLTKHGDRNLYFHVNTTMRDLTKKADREDIKSVDWLHIDIDPRAGEDLVEERDRALALLTSKPPRGVPPPTVIIFSGGGYQAFWKLEESIQIDGDLPKAEDAKRWNQWLETKFGADNCHNIDRIMRLPGTVNWPGARKVKKDKARTPTLAKLVEFNDRVYTLGAFTKAEAIAEEAQTEEPVGPVDLEHLDPKTVEIIKLGIDPDNPTRWDNDRSDGVWFVACEMARADFKGGEIMAVLLDKAYKISDHIYDTKRTDKAQEGYARRQARRALDEVIDTFATDDDGKKFKTQRNIRLAIRKLGVKLRYNEFTHKAEITGLPEHGPALQDDAVTDMRLTIEERFSLTVAKERFEDIVDNVARRDRYNPILDYLDGLTWDGVPRLDTWLTVYGSAVDDEYTRAVGALPFIAAVRRAREPGTKFDEMLVFISKQGLNKSSAIKALVPDQKYFSDSLPLGAKSQEVCEQIAGKWIIEFAELHGMTAAKIERIKAFMSRQVDIARMAYGHIPEEFPRQCIFIGTTNTRKFMSDITGGRRFWPVDVKTFDLAALRRDRDQLWAEAAHREADGESIRLDAALWDVAAEHQEEHRAENQFIPVLRECLGTVEGKLSAALAWTILGISTERRSQAYNELLGEAMKLLGWKRKRLRFLTGVKPEYGYIKGHPKRPREIKLARNKDGQWYVVRSTTDTVKELKRQLKAAEAETALDADLAARCGDQLGLGEGGNEA